MGKKSYVATLCLSAVMSAIYVGLDWLANNSSVIFGGSLKISLSGLPILIVAFFYGPLWGAACGFVGAFLGQIIFYGFEPMTLIWVLPAVVRGLSSGLLFKAFKNSTSPLKLTIVTCISSILVTAFNTLAKCIDFAIKGVYYEGAPASYAAILIEVPQRLIVGIITAMLLSLMLPTIIDSIKKTIK